MGQERQVGWGLGCGRGVFGISARASGGAGGDPRLFTPALIEVVVRHGFRLSGIELGALVEVVGKGLLGGLVVFHTLGPGSSAALGTELSERSTLYVEWFGLFSHALEDDFSINIFNLGVDYYVNEDFVLDIRVGKGLSPDSDDFFSGVGGGIRF